MIRRIGVDVVSVPRVSNLIRRYGDRFLHRWFTPAEIVECETADHPDRYFATCLAVKEAVFKSLDLDRRRTVPWRHIEVRGVRTWTAQVDLHGPLQYLQHAIERFVISTSLSAGIAIAFVIAIAEDRELPGDDHAETD